MKRDVKGQKARQTEADAEEAAEKSKKFQKHHNTSETLGI